MEYFRQRFIDELNEEGDIEICRMSWTRQEAIEILAPSTYQNAFDEWTRSAIEAAQERAAAFLRENGCMARFQRLCQRQANQSVIPFVGAGMSIASGFTSWGDFLIALVGDAPDALPEVRRLINQADFEAAAQAVEIAVGADVLAEEIESKLGDHRPRVDGPVQLLPYAFDRECVTTNFDHVLPKVYRAADLPFREIYCGDRLSQALRRAGEAPRCLLRLHGDANERAGRILTQNEYDDAYDESGLPNLIRGLVGMKSLLFMGCSLLTDRTFTALREIKDQAQVEPVRHYAFLPEPDGAQRNARRAQLAEAEIYPIFYPADEHDQSIEDLLIALIEGGFDD